MIPKKSKPKGKRKVAIPTMYENNPNSFASLSLSPKKTFFLVTRNKPQFLFYMGKITHENKD